MDLRNTDPEFAGLFERFLHQEVQREASHLLSAAARHLAILAALVGCGGVQEYTIVLPQALEAGLSPIMVKELLYQSSSYLGLGRMLPFLTATNAAFERLGITLPLPSQSTTTPETRLERGARAQADIFGEEMLNAWEKGSINRWLAGNCFGDFYTRTGLELNQREMITFCLLMAQGGCEPQLEAHIRGNMRLGNDANFLAQVAMQCLPFVGYPRILNAIACIEKVAAAERKISKRSEKNTSEGVCPKPLFGAGAPNREFERYFTGRSYLKVLSTQGVTVCNVTFEPGCRNNWHIHRSKAGGGQLLLCTDGEGWYQEWGKPARALRPGDVVIIPAGVKHWHGAAKSSWFSHISAELPGEDTSNEWLEPVSDAAYNALG